MIRQEFPVLELGWVPLISLPPPELRGLSRFEISKYRNFQYSNYESEKKTKMQQINVMKVFFFFSAVVQLGLPSIFSDEILRNHNETTF